MAHRVLPFVLLSMFRGASAALCSNYETQEVCLRSNDGGCACVWNEKGCAKGDVCSGVGITSVGVDDSQSKMMTCGEVKAEYKKQGCCGSPMGSFSMPAGERRLSQHEDLLEKLQVALQRTAQQEGPAQASALAKSLRELVQAYMQDS
eukprot:TRINITY_DN30059_c0_g1_i1.p1 TRINITY_DN30059_c0_g1~~TRINITY_DN30059_c0_g1_i1.p1  ORF type:complete len:167 (+),score=36.69 TRINITY_DN30059_c0_g1_i1:58-501(+)